MPHVWLLATSAAKLRNFLDKGPALNFVTDETLAAKGDEMDRPTIANVMEEDDRIHGEKGRSHHPTAGEWEGHGPAPDANATANITIAWSVRLSSLSISGLTQLQTIDRVLDIMLAPPKRLKKKTNNIRRGHRVISLSPSASVTSGNDGRAQSPVEEVFKRADGVEPPVEDRMEIDEWEKRAGRVLNEDDAEEIAPLVTWCFVSDHLHHSQIFCTDRLTWAQ